MTMGFLRRRRLHQVEEAAALARALQVHRDDLCLRVVRHVLQQVRLVDVAGVAVADRVAEAQAASLRLAAQLDRVAAALRDEADRPALLREVAAGQERVAARRTVHAEAVRPDDANALRRDAPDLLLQRHPLRVARLREAGAVDLRAVDALRQALAEHLRHQRRRHHDVGGVDGLRDVGDGRVDAQAEDLAAAGVDGEQPPFEAEVDQRVEEAAAPSVLVRGSADDRESAREEDSVELGRLSMRPFESDATRQAAAASSSSSVSIVEDGFGRNATAYMFSTRQR